ncbi:hypothetical protein B0H16DRAFT_225000 [Mycena metata]|uniref:DUF6533 domain-containing protein n=1 Tax=Mycena metata TaxID=1033252 RepID=A0AAD7MSA7_9AGAR|nr:hypothetical protein B0H16DRAFT_225000 [Mycena metata]
MPDPPRPTTERRPLGRGRWKNVAVLLSPSIKTSVEPSGATDSLKCRCSSGFSINSEGTFLTLTLEEMADYETLLKELETVLLHTTVSHYTIVSSLCLYVYDFFLTFPMEVEYFWNSPWSLVKAMFFWNRYLTFPTTAYLAFSEINRLPTAALCFAQETTGLILSLVCISGAQVVMQIRVHALYGQNRTLKIIVSCLFFIAVASELGIAIAKLVTDGSSVQPIPFLVDPLSLCVGPIPKFLIAYPVPMMAFDTILLILVVYKAYLIQREEASDTTHKTWTSSRLVRVMFRDSVIYFTCTFGVNLFNVLVWLLAPYDLFTVGTSWAATVPVMAASRILFNMRLEYHDHSPGVTKDGDSIGTEFQVARPFEGSTMGSVSSDADVESSVDNTLRVDGRK